MNKKILVLLAEGFEEIEAVTPIDVLRRAGLDVIVAGVGQKTVAGNNGIKIEADILLEEYQGLPDAVFLPGGMRGATKLRASEKVADLLRRMNAEGKWVTAICASPAIVLAPTGILQGKQATCYPGFEKNFDAQIKFSEERVVTDGHVVTSRGPGTAMEMSIDLVEKLVSKEVAADIKQKLLMKSA